MPTSKMPSYNVCTFYTFFNNSRIFLWTWWDFQRQRTWSLYLLLQADVRQLYSYSCLFRYISIAALLESFIVIKLDEIQISSWSLILSYLVMFLLIWTMETFQCSHIKKGQFEKPLKTFTKLMITSSESSCVIRAKHWCQMPDAILGKNVTNNVEICH